MVKCYRTLQEPAQQASILEVVVAADLHLNSNSHPDEVKLRWLKDLCKIGHGAQVVGLPQCSYEKLYQSSIHGDEYFPSWEVVRALYLDANLGNDFQDDERAAEKLRRAIAIQKVAMSSNAWACHPDNVTGVAGRCHPFSESCGTFEIVGPSDWDTMQGLNHYGEAVPPDDLYHLLGMIYGRLGRNDLVKEAYEGACKHAPQIRGHFHMCCAGCGKAVFPRAREIRRGKCHQCPDVRGPPDWHKTVKDQ